MVLVFIFLNCITIALERPDIQANSTVRNTHEHTALTPLRTVFEIPLFSRNESF